jgi:hypothetical protein
MELVSQVTAYACMRKEKVRGSNSVVEIPIRVQAA